MLTALRRLMRRQTPLELASREMAEAEMSRLVAQTGHDYSRAMTDYHTSRITRLRSFIAAQSKEQNNG